MRWIGFWSEGETKLYSFISHRHEVKPHHHHKPLKKVGQMNTKQKIKTGFVCMNVGERCVNDDRHVVWHLEVKSLHNSSSKQQ